MIAHARERCHGLPRGHVRKCEEVHLGEVEDSLCGCQQHSDRYTGTSTYSHAGLPCRCLGLVMIDSLKDRLVRHGHGLHLVRCHLEIRMRFLVAWEGG